MKKKNQPSEYTTESILSTANTLRWEIGEHIHDTLVESLYADANQIAARAVTAPSGRTRFDFDRRLDQLITSRWLGFPLMFLMLALVFWLTVEGANVPSAMIASFLVDTVHPWLKSLLLIVGSPWWLTGLMVDGVWLAMA
ncbi:MAG: hypothetical protein WCX28_04310, partial [Bacteriovoracaceae bacterium]